MNCRLIPRTPPTGDRNGPFAKSAALPYWTSLTTRYPSSRHVPQALYHAGVIQAETEKPDDAAAAFEQLTRKYPDSRWSGDAHVRLIDVELERRFDLPGARRHVAAAVEWHERHGAEADNSPRPLGEGQEVRVFPAPFADDLLPSPRETGYAIYLRAGLIEYLSEHADRAVAFFEKAAPLQPEQTFVVVSGHIPTGIERLIDAAKSGKALTPEVVRQGDEKAKLILMLADVYHEGEEWQRSLELCTRVIAGAAAKANREQRSYACYRRARNYYSLAGTDYNPDAAFSDYALAFRMAPKAPWADDALFLAANLQWNDKENPDRAIDLWRRLIEFYPKSKEADRSAYYIGVAYEWSHRPAEAAIAYAEFLDQRPDSRFAREARKRLVEIQRQRGQGIDGKGTRSHPAINK